MKKSAGAMSSVTMVRIGDSTAMITSETTNSSALLDRIGRNESSPWTSPMSVIARLTICPVSSASWDAPSRRDRARNTSSRMSYCTSSESRPALNRRANVVANCTTARATSRPIQTPTPRCGSFDSTVSITYRMISGTVALMAAPTTAAVIATVTSRRCRMQYPISRRNHPASGTGGDWAIVTMIEPNRGRRHGGGL